MRLLLAHRGGDGEWSEGRVGVVRQPLLARPGVGVGAQGAPPCAGWVPIVCPHHAGVKITPGVTISAPPPPCPHFGPLRLPLPLPTLPPLPLLSAAGPEA